MKKSRFTEVQVPMHCGRQRLARSAGCSESQVKRVWVMAQETAGQSA